MGIPVHLIENGIDWPAWVQAIGSIIAIAVAIAVPWFASWRRREDFRRTVLAYGRMIRNAVRATAISDGIEPTIAEKYAIQLTAIEVKLSPVLEVAKQLPLDRLQHAAANEVFVRLVGAALTFQEERKSSNLANEVLFAGGVNGLTVQRAAYDQVCARFNELEKLLQMRTWMVGRR